MKIESEDDLIPLIMRPVCLLSVFGTFIWAAASGFGLLGCLAAALAALIGSMFVTAIVLYIVFGIANRWKELLTLSCIVLFFWLLLMAVRYFVPPGTDASAESVSQAAANSLPAVHSPQPPELPIPYAFA
jgi:uncharacterized membrane-anchored protein